MSNEALSKKVFHSGSGEILTLAEVAHAIKHYVTLYPDAYYEIVIGSDSQASLTGKAIFATAVVVRRIGNGGVHFWARQEGRFFSLKDRIWREAMMSITLAQEFRSVLKEALGEEMFWDEKLSFRCIHLDIGEAGPTRELIDSVAGMVRGYGFEPVIKPFAYGASVVADRHT